MEDTAVAQVLGQGRAQMRIVENAEVFRLRRVGGAKLSWLYLEFGLSETSSLDQNLI